MSFLDLFKRQPISVTPQHAIIVSLPAALIDMETTEYEESALKELEDQLMDALVDADAGEFWENEFLPDKVSTTFAGPDAERMFTVMEPVLRVSQLGRRARVTLRQGGAGAPQREVTIA